MASTVEQNEGDAAEQSSGRHRTRRAVVVVLVLVVVLAAGVAAWVVSRPDPPERASLAHLPERSDGGYARLAGPYVLASNGTSFVGYRAQERFGPVNAPNEAVGRTTAVEGRLAIADDAVTLVEVTADMTKVQSNNDIRNIAMRNAGLETSRYPKASFALTKPVHLGSAAKGKVLHFKADGDLTLHGVTRRVVAVLDARWNGSTIQVAGSIPVELAKYHIEVASKVEFAGLHVNGRGTAEFELVFAPSSTTVTAKKIPTLRHDPPTRDVFAPPDKPCTNKHDAAGVVVFGSPRDVPDEGENLWRVSADGSGLKRLTDTLDVDERDPAVSPDGAMIAYDSNDHATQVPTVWVMAADGSNRHRLLSADQLQAQLGPAWSPDGSKLVFSGGSVDVPWDVQLFTANADGTSVERLTTSDGRFHGSPAWSPDGRTVAYESYGQKGADELFTVNVKNGKSTRLTNDPALDSSPEWLSNRTLLFSHDGRLARIDLKTRRVKLGTGGSTGYLMPKLAADHRTVLLTRNGNLYTAGLDGSHRACLPTGRTASTADWLAD